MSKSPSPPPSASPRHVVIADPDPRERERALKAIEMLRSAPDSELGELVLHTATDGRDIYYSTFGGTGTPAEFKAKGGGQMDQAFHNLTTHA